MNMGRQPKPWWRADRGSYFATVNGKRYDLGSNLKKAKEKLKDLIKSPLPEYSYGDLIAICFDQFLTWTKQHRAAASYDSYKRFIESFCQMFPNLTPEDLSVRNITEWLNKHPQWGATTQANAITALQRAMSWSCSNLGIKHNPLRGMIKPSRQSHAEAITPEQFDEILSNVKGKCFRRLLVFCYDTGARPREANRLQPRHIELDRSRCVIPASEAKGGSRG